MNFQNMIDGFAVNQRAGAGGIVADHAADIGAITRCGFRRKMQAGRFDLLIQFIAHETRLNAHPTLVLVQLKNAIHEFGTINHQRLADGLAGQARAAPARQNRHAVFRRGANRLHDIVFVARDNHANRLNLVQAGVGAVQIARDLVKIYFAFDFAPEFDFEVMEI
ncbi:MAG: hypothetical protein ILNGONEN_00820 [Syntrophorhabdaceae bacterium]|nr:hypothetical protein [Syntrophorhabdaceae bacterium]